MRSPVTRKRVVATVVLFGLICTALWWKSLESSIDVTVSFAGYTRDTRGIRGALYSVPDASENSLALLRIDNRTADWSFAYTQGRIQLRSGDSWIADPNQLPRVWDHGRIEAGTSVLVWVPVPVSSNAWRCRMILTGTRTGSHARWKKYMWAALNWVGLRKSSRDFVVMSPEIVK